MKVEKFRRLQVGDEVYTHFSNAYRRAVVIGLEAEHVCVEGDAVKGGKLTRRASYRSVDTRAVGRKRLGMAGFSCAYCGGNDEDPQDHCVDCERPMTPNVQVQPRPIAQQPRSEDA